MRYVYMAAAVYLFIGVLVTALAIYTAYKLDDPDLLETRRQWKTFTPKQKVEAYANAVWFGLILWLPVALGWVERKRP